MNILYIKIKNSSFIKVDEDILRRNYNIKTFLLNPRTPFTFLFTALKLIGFLITNLFWADIYFTRFADYHAGILTFFSKFFKTKTIIVIGGFDVALIPDFNYGAHINKFRSKIVKYALKHSDLLLPNAEALIDYENNYRESPVRGGILHFVPKPKGKIKVINNGFDIKFWNDLIDIRKENIALTVAKVTDLRTFKLKGIDCFIKIAKELPEFKFIIIGMSHDFINENNIEVPVNVTVIDFLGQSELVKYYLKSKVFCLFSISEGMPNVLCEAMLCECIPVGSNVTSIPEIIGDTGIIIKKQNIVEMITQVRKAFSLSSEYGKRARKRIMGNYSLDKREKEITNILKTFN